MRTSTNAHLNAQSTGSTQRSYDESERTRNASLEVVKVTPSSSCANIEIVPEVGS